MEEKKPSDDEFMDDELGNEFASDDQIDKDEALKNFDDELNQENAIPFSSPEVAETKNIPEPMQNQFQQPVQPIPQQQEAPYSRLGGPLFVSLPKYRKIGSMLSLMMKKTNNLAKQLGELKDMRNKGTKLLSETLDNLESIEDNIGQVNDTLKVKS